jgi:hypothetical protein
MRRWGVGWPCLSQARRGGGWLTAEGSVFHAMVSVMAVKIQLSSPSGVLRSWSLPGIWSTKSGSRSPMDRRFCVMNHRSATRMGVVRQAVKMSAGNLGSIGSSSLPPHGASTMHSRCAALVGPPPAPSAPGSGPAACCRAAIIGLCGPW